MIIPQVNRQDIKLFYSYLALTTRKETFLNISSGLSSYPKLCCSSLVTRTHSCLSFGLLLNSTKSANRKIEFKFEDDNLTKAFPLIHIKCYLILSNPYFKHRIYVVKKIKYPCIWNIFSIVYKQLHKERPGSDWYPILSSTISGVTINNLPIPFLSRKV